MRSIAITGVGVFTPLGRTWETFSERLLSGIGAIRDAELSFEGRPTLKVPLARIEDFDAELELPNFKTNSWDRATKMAVLAARQCIATSGLHGSDLEGLVVGTSTNSVEGMDDSYYRMMLGNGRVSPMSIPKSMPNASAAAICIDQGITGFSYSVASACSSANQALINAALLVQTGQAKRILCGAAEASLFFSNVTAWHGMRVVAKDTCRPFCKTRSGLVLGEGSAFFVLEEKEEAERRRAKIWAEISGWGMTSDARSATKPCTKGIAAALTSALKHSKLMPEDIDYLNAHGTGTLLNDVTESSAINDAFGPSAMNLPVSSTKSLHGHLLGASGAIELAATIAAIQNGIIPPTVNWVEPDENVNIQVVKNTPMQKEIKHALSASYAFGGHNTVLAVSAP